MQKFDVAVVGGGASGLACAIKLKSLSGGLSVVLIDANKRLGKKLAATGNGQGNVTNLDMRAEKYFCSDRALVEKIVCGKVAESAERELFHCLLSADSQGRVYPSGRQASALCDSLIFDLKRLGVTVLEEVKVTALKRGYFLTLSDGNEIAAKYVVLAFGGKAQKQFSTDGTAYALATGLGHSVTDLFPSLVQLRTDMRYTKSLKGIRVDCSVAARCGGETLAERRGDVIFTEYGVTGNAIFSLSPYVTGRSGVQLCFDFLPDVSSVEDIIKNNKRLGYVRDELLCGTLHNQLGRAVMRRVQGDDPAEINRAVKAFTVDVTGTLGFDYAQVTRGGIPLREVTEELESRLAPYLFIVGEALDVDGECGGYNLHWAFTSGMRAAAAIAERCARD